MRMLRSTLMLEKFSCGKSTAYRWTEDGLLTRRGVLGVRAVRWPECEIDAILNARIAGKSDEEIRALVASLEAARGAAA